ncbi:hypothetical protein F434_15259, partial [Salmonella enterica subsp. enterica serovar Agona str. SH11G1113]
MGDDPVDSLCDPAIQRDQRLMERVQKRKVFRGWRWFLLQKAMGILMTKNARRLSTNCESQVLKSKGVCLSRKLLSSRLIHNVWHRAFVMKKKPWKSTS